MLEEQNIGEITRAYRGRLGAEFGHRLTQAGFGDLIGQGWLNDGVSRITVNNWERGKTEPELRFLLSVYTYYFTDQQDWRFQWAVACLRAMLPETFDSGVIELAHPDGR